MSKAKFDEQVTNSNPITVGCREIEASPALGTASKMPFISSLPDGKICDFIYGTIRNDTPEEYVRQNIERRLVKELGYNPERIAVEFMIKIGSAKKQVDIAIFPESAQHLQENIDIIIECKHEKVKPSERLDYYPSRS